MIAYGVCVGPGDNFATHARPSLARHAPDSRLILRHGQRSIFEAYASIVAEAATIPALEALVLIHDDVELGEPLDEGLRRAFAAGFSLVGPVGGQGVPSMTWWHGTPRGQVGRPAGLPAEDHGGGTHPVDALDGLCLALAPEALSRLRLFRGRYPAWHGYDAEISAQIRTTGGAVGVVPLAMTHHAGVHYDSAAYRLAQLAWEARWAGSARQRRVALGKYALHRAPGVTGLLDRVRR